MKRWHWEHTRTQMCVCRSVQCHFYWVIVVRTRYVSLSCPLPKLNPRDSNYFICSMSYTLPRVGHTAVQPNMQTGTFLHRLQHKQEVPLNQDITSLAHTASRNHNRSWYHSAHLSSSGPPVQGPTCCWRCSWSTQLHSRWGPAGRLRGEGCSHPGPALPDSPLSSQGSAPVRAGSGRWPGVKASGGQVNTHTQG